jgi:hypothetical protein
VLGDKARAQCRKTCGLCSVNDCQVGGTVLSCPPLKFDPLLYEIRLLAFRAFRAFDRDFLSVVVRVLQDKSAQCLTWVSRGQCNLLGTRDFMQQACARSCGYGQCR